MMKHLILIIFVVLFSPFSYCQNNFTFPPLEISLNINQLTANENGVENKIGFGMSIKRKWNG
jgi:hypothetical protein